jgi:hypothetical protein
LGEPVSEQLLDPVNVYFEAPQPGEALQIVAAR